MKLIGLVVLGFVASLIVFLLLILALIAFTNIDKYGDGYILGICWLITMLLGLFAGSIITGYLSYHKIQNKWFLLLMVPTLYLYICFAVIALLISALILEFDFIRHLIFFVVGLLFYLPSLAGVGLGYFLRGKIVRHRYSD